MALHWLERVRYEACATMNAVLLAAAVLALLLFIYLFVALLRPEWF